MTSMQVKSQPNALVRWGRIVAKDMRRHYEIYLLALPMVAFFVIFSYFPMYGVIIAFKQYQPNKGILGSAWVGLQHFRDFFGAYYFGRVIKNTFFISINNIIWGFPAPILFALLLNELGSNRFKRVVQTVTYMPHFISTVVMCGIIRQFVTDKGIISYIIEFFGGERANLLLKANAFVPIYVISGIWQEIGWGAIIYLSAFSQIDTELYDAAYIDGAGRLRRVWHVTIPGIAPTIITLFILRLGRVMSVGYEKILLLYNSTIYETSDVISTYVYRKGLLESDWSFSSAVGLFNSLINVLFVVVANQISRKVNETSLW